MAVGALGANAIRVDAEPDRTVRRVDEPICPASDGSLRLRVPCRWTFSIGVGMEGRERAAWILTGNFPFPDDYATHKGTPDVPRDGVLIGIGDLTVGGHPEAVAWPSVRRLHLPTRQIRGREISWRVRFSGRALMLSIQFGGAARRGNPSRQRSSRVDDPLDGRLSRTGLVAGSSCPDTRVNSSLASPRQDTRFRTAGSP